MSLIFNPWTEHNVDHEENDFGKATVKYSYHFEPDIVEFIKLNFSYRVEENIVNVTYDGIA